MPTDMTDNPEPCDSLKHLLHALAPSFSEDDLTTFIKALDVPQDCRYLQFVCSILATGPDALQNCLQEEEHRALATAIAGLEEITALPQLHEVPPHGGALHGLMESHPLFATIALLRDAAGGYRQFLLHFFHAYLKWGPRMATRLPWRVSVCRAARRFGHTTVRVLDDTAGIQISPLSCFPSILVLLPQDTVGFKSYQAKFAGASTALTTDMTVALDGADSKRLLYDVEIKTLDDLALVFENIIPTHKVGDRRGRVGRKKNASMTHYITRPAMPGSSVETITNMPSADVDGDEDEDDELLLAPTYTKVHSSKPLFSNKDDRYLYIGHENQTSILARASQCLPLDVDALNAADLETFARQIDSSNNGPDSLEVRSYLMLVFVTGQLPSLLADLRWSSLLSGKEDSAHLAEDGRLAFPAWTPHPNLYEEERHGTTHIVRLPSRCIEMLTELRNVHPGGHGDRVFKSNELNLRRKAQKWFQAMNTEFGTRATLSRLHGTLFRWIQNMPEAGISVAIQLTGLTANPGNDSPTYQLLDFETLKRQWSAAWVRMSQWAELPASWLDSDLVTPANPSLGFGSRRAPDMGPLLAMRATRAAELKSMRRDFPHDHSIVDQHNYFMLEFYVFLVVALGTRPVQHLILHPGCLNLKRGTIYVSDKDSRRFRHSRIIYLGQTICAAFEELLNHLDVLVIHLAQLNPESAVELQWREPPLPSHSRAKLLDNAIAMPRLLFLLTESGVIESMKPPLALAPYLDLDGVESNFGRHNFRSGCDNSVVDAIFCAHNGHHLVGQETMSRFSSISPVRVREAMTAYMEKRLAKDDPLAWHAPRSPLL